MKLSVEDQICVDLNDHVRKTYPQWRKSWWHNPNGGFRPKQTARRFKAMGVLPGVSDYQITRPSNGYPGLFLEIKKEKGGHVEDVQKEFLKEQRLNGYMGIITFGYDESKMVIDAWFRNETWLISWMQNSDSKSERNAAYKERTPDSK